MKKILVFAIIASMFVVLGCNNKKSNDELSNAFRVGLKYACPLNLLTENVFKDKIYIYLDGGNSSVDATTGKWTGNGAHIVFVMNRPTGTGLPIGTFSIGSDILEASYCEDFNNEGNNYMPIIPFKEGILVSSYNSGEYNLDFTGTDQNDSLVLMKFNDGLSYVFDYSDKNGSKR